MTEQFYKALYSMLPLFSEEGRFCDRIAIASLKETLQETSGLDEQSVEAMIQITERLFFKLALLDKNELTNKYWAFVSYPAFLLARSLVTTLQDEQQLLLPKNFWRTEQGSQAIEQQRNLLGTIEEFRINNHINNDARPVRYVYVSCAFFKYGNSILFHHREDKRRPEVNNFVLVGGKTNLFDVENIINKDSKVLLQNGLLKQSLDAGQYQKIKQQTIIREIEEETGLRYQQDYQLIHLESIAAFNELEGAANTFSYSQYIFDLYHIQLNTKGQIKLLEATTDNESLQWLNLNTMNTSTLGLNSYLEFLIKHLGSQDTVVDYIKQLPDSFINDGILSNDFEQLIIPYKQSSFYQFKQRTKEPVKISFELDEIEKELLCLLVCHGRQLPLESKLDLIKLLPAGWIKINDEQLLDTFQHLERKLLSEKLTLFTFHQTQYVKLIYPIDKIYLPYELFYYSLREQNLNDYIEIGFKNSLFSLFSILTLPFSQKLSPLFIQQLKKVEKNVLDFVDDENFQKRVREKIRPHTQLLGLKNFITIENGHYKLLIDQHEEITSPRFNS